MIRVIKAGVVILPMFLLACGGEEGAGQIDYGSPTVVADLQSQMSNIDSSITVTAGNNSSIVLTKGTESIILQSGTASAATIEVSGRMYSVNIDPTGAYTFSPSVNPRSAANYIANSKLILEGLSVVGDKLGLDPNSGVVDLTLGTKNTLVMPEPKVITLSTTGSANFSGTEDDISASGTVRVSQSMTLTHNFTDDSVIAAKRAGWDGTGVNLTILDNFTNTNTNSYVISQTGTALLTVTDGNTTETDTLTINNQSNLLLSHGDKVSGIASGLNWKSQIFEYYGAEVNDDCSGATSVGESFGGFTLTSQTTVQSNHCSKIGVATGANTDFLDYNNVNPFDLIQAKNATGELEILNFSFGRDEYRDLDFADAGNVLIVQAAGNDSEPNNGYDVYADGKGVDGRNDTGELMEIALTESDFANNLIAVGALDTNNNIAHYSTIAGPDYDGSTYAFLVDDGTFSLEFAATTSLSGDLQFQDNNGNVLSGNLSGSITEELSISDQGTSYATPRVSGKMAITSHKFPNLNAEQLVNLAKHTAIDLGDSGVDQIYGYGKVNLTGMLSPIGRLN